MIVKLYLSVHDFIDDFVVWKTWQNSAQAELGRKVSQQGALASWVSHVPRLCHFALQMAAIPLPPIEGSQEFCCLKICTGLASYAQCSLETQGKSGIFRCSGPKSLGTSLKAKHCAVHESNSSNDFRVLVTPGHEANMNLVNLVKLKKLTKRFRQRVLLVWICISRRFVGFLNLNVQFAKSFQWFWSCILHGVFVSFETGSSEHSDLENVQNGPGAWCHAMSTHC